MFPDGQDLMLVFAGVDGIGVDDCVVEHDVDRVVEVVEDDGEVEVVVMVLDDETEVVVMVLNVV